MSHLGMSSGSRASTRHTTWSENEWDCIASEMNRQHPGKKTTSYAAFHFELEQFEDAMENVIAQERQKSFTSSIDVKDSLFQAYCRMYDRNPLLQMAHAKSSAQTHDGGVRTPIRWTPKELADVAIKLNEVLPTGFVNKLENLCLGDIRAAVNVLQPHRRRTFAALDAFRQQMLKTWAELPANYAEEHNKNLAVVEFASGPVKEPALRKADQSSSIATAMHEAFKSNVDPIKVRKAYVIWTDEEWLMLAREMHHQNPHFDFFGSTFSSIDLPAVRDAQREVFPLERRKVLTGSANLQAPLVKAFKALAIEIENAKLENQATPNAPIAVDTTPQPVAALYEHFSVAPSQVPYQGTQLAMPQSDFANKMVQAATPLLQVMFGEIAKLMVPEVIKAITPVIEKSMSEFQSFVTASMAQHPSQVTMQSNSPLIGKPMNFVTPSFAKTDLNQPQSKPKKPKIAVLGPLGKQQDDIRNSFKEFEFIFIENGHGIKEAGQKCELFISAQSHTISSYRDAIKSHVPKEKHRSVTGGTSMIKHQINVWKAQQPQV